MSESYEFSKYFSSTYLNDIAKHDPVDFRLAKESQIIGDDVLGYEAKHVYSRRMVVECNFQLPIGNYTDVDFKAAERDAQRFIIKRLYGEVVDELQELHYMLDFEPASVLKKKIEKMVDKITKEN